MSRSIAYIAGYFPLRSETFVYREVRELRRRGWQVCAVSLNPLREQREETLADLEKDKITVYEPGWSGEAFFGFLRHPIRGIKTVLTAVGDALSPGEPTSPRDRVKTIAQAFAGIKLGMDLRQSGVTHLHCHFAHAPATVGMYAAQFLNIPFSMTGHANDLFQRRHLLGKKLQRSKFVACISQWHQDFYRAIEPDGRYAVIRCGVPVEGWCFKQPVHRADGILRVLTVCRLVEKKGVDHLIRALHGFGSKTGRDWLLTVAGDGPELDKLQSIARDLKLSDKIEFLGAVENENVPGMLAQADVFALPCRTDASGDKDGIPVVLMEAMACGTPVIAGDLPAIRELVEDTRSGLLVDGTNIESIIGALEYVDQSPEVRVTLAQLGRKRIEEEFSLGENVAKLEKLFETTDEHR